MQYNPLPKILPMDNGGRLWVGSTHLSLSYLYIIYVMKRLNH